MSVHRVSRRRLIGLVRVWCTLVLLVSVLVPGAGVSPAVAQQIPSNPPPPSKPTGPNVDQGLVRQLSQDTGGGARIEYHRETGKARFIGASPARPIPRSARLAANASPEVAARSFMASYGPLFGTQDESRDLALKRVKADTGGRSIVRFAQQYSGIPVFAGEVIVHLDKGQNVQAAIGELLPDIAVTTTPQVSTTEAKATARAVVARDEQVNEAQLQAGEPELQIYNRALIGDPGPKVTQLVWRIEVSAGPREPIRYLVLVDALVGGVALRFNQVPDAKNRQTYTANGGSSLPGTLVCNEANPTCSGGDADAAAAHKFAGDTYDFYLSRHGRDSIDGSGLTLQSSVHYDPTPGDGVAYANAFWNGAQMIYGNGFSLADDVVGHELTHGVTQYESDLFYFRQAGAINESLSDLWGEWIDQANGSGTDTPGVKWLLGEDVPVLGAFRNMANPPAFNDPDRMTSPNYYGSSLDNGGVHHNSGVINKAAFLMTDGGTFNGKTVTGLGIDKTAKLYYEAQTNLLTPGSDYGDLYTALQQACSTLTGTGIMTVADCQQVQNAIDAVEMNLAPVVAGAAPPNPPFCPTGQSPTDLFFDDLENVTTTTSNFSHTLLSGGDSWSYPQAAQYTSTTSGTKNFHGLDRATTASYVMTRSADVTLPAGAYLRFNHSWRFDTTFLGSTPSYWDGGILEYSTNGGTSWLNASSLIASGEGGYTGTLVSGSGNPLGGQAAWVGLRDYAPTRVTLSSLAGQSFRFRFRIGTDSVGGAEGWFIDDVRIYTCGATPTPGITVSPTSGLQTTEAGGTTQFTVKLGSQPTANVTISLSSSNTNEGTVSPSSLTFTAANWSTPQTVTVTGVNDDVDDGNVAYTILTAPATSTDANYNNRDAADVSVTNLDDDSASIVVSPTSGLLTSEGGQTAQFTVALASRPTANVTIAISSSNTNEGTVSPSSLTFTPANWSTPQTVTVTGVNDDIDDGAVAYTIVTGAAVSTDPNYSGLNPSDVPVTNQDDGDTAGFTVSPTTGLQTTEAGGAAQFTVKLTSQPTANVTVGLSSSNTNEGTVSPSSLTFTPANWSTAQTVTVTGVNDTVVDGPVAYTIVTAAAVSTDPNYSGLNPPDVSVTNTDNDGGATQTLSLVLAGSGTGFVTSVPAGIVCDWTCAHAFSSGTPVVMRAIPSPGSSFAGWSGGGCSATGDCAVTMDAAKTITAQFTRTSFGPCVSPGFGAPSPAATGTNPGAIAVADFDGDGTPDVAVANYGQQGLGSITVLWGKAAGGFDPPTIVPTPDVPAVVAGDFDGDGKADLATFHYSTSSGAMRLGKANRTFGQPISFATGAGPTSAVAVDLNGDGLLDLALANNADTSLTLLFGTGGGNLSSPQLLMLPHNPHGLAVGDFNGDRKPDLAATLYLNNTVAILLGDGAGGFTPASGSPFAAGTQPLHVTVGRFNGDGHADLAIANGQSPTLSVLLGMGTGAFGVPSPVPVGSQYGYAVVTADFTGDGLADLAVTNRDSKQVSILRGKGDGTFASAVSFGSGGSGAQGPTHLAVVDIDREGRPDLIVANSIDDAEGVVSSLLNACQASPPAGITVSPTSGLQTTEAGGQATFTVKLDSQPTANVTIGLSSSDTTEGTVSPTSLTFTPANWSTPQTVTVTGVDDAAVDGPIAYTIVTAQAVSTDPAYNGLNPPDVSITNTDNDVPMQTLQIKKSGSGTVFGPGGINCGPTCSANFPDGTQVVLTAAPAAGWIFKEWSGSCSGPGTCPLTMNGPKDVTAIFTQSVGLSVSRSRSSAGQPMLASTISIRPECGSITQIQFGRNGVPLQNARVSITVPGAGPQQQTNGFVYRPPLIPATTSVTFTIERAVQVGGATVNPVTISSTSCTDWVTFVGGGAGAFPP